MRDLDGDRYAAWNPRRVSPVRRHVQLVELVVDLFDRVEVPLRRAVAETRSRPPDGRRDLAHALDQPARARAHLLAEPARGAPCDVRGEVAVALDLAGSVRTSDTSRRRSAEVPVPTRKCARDLGDQPVHEIVDHLVVTHKVLRELPRRRREARAWRRRWPRRRAPRRGRPSPRSPRRRSDAGSPRRRRSARGCDAGVESHLNARPRLTPQCLRRWR